jgi:hypothetical protein
MIPLTVKNHIAVYVQTEVNVQIKRKEPNSGQSGRQV